jgi:tRNA dimethylallyltransferase
LPANRKIYNLITILGPTASGKTRFAVELAFRLEGEIVSCDSRQIYRRMSIGTGKDLEEYIVNGCKVPYHLIDIKEPGYKYNVFEFQKDFYKVFEDICQRKKMPLLCGGTGLYIEAVTKAYKLIGVPVNQELRDRLSSKSLPDLIGILASYRNLHNKSDSDTVKRAIRAIEIEEYARLHPEIETEFPAIHPLYIGINIDRDLRREKITNRLKSRFEEGMIDEVKALMVEGISAEDLIYYGLEYKFVSLYLTGKLSYKSMVEQLNIAIHQFAKRQMTWFRKMENDGCDIFWIDGKLDSQEKLKIALDYIDIHQNI